MSQETEPAAKPIAFRPELVHESAFLAPTAVVVGDVTLGPQSSVWFGAVLRGDADAIRVGARSNVQDNAVLHADPGFPCTVGDGVTVGHLAIVHGAEVGDNVIVGMRSVVMNGAKIGANSLIAAGAVVTEGTQIPPGSLVVGMPAKVTRELRPAEIDRLRRAAEHYVQNARRYGGGQ
jgi:carbonic anhydrase/acetyltransferase-like protein (isoleucine patch superfamily)